jgi:hypothetical protein
VNEEIITALVGGDEAVAFIVLNHFTVPWAIPGAHLPLLGLH